MKIIQRSSPKYDITCCLCHEDPEEPITTLCGHVYCWPCHYCRYKLRAIGEKEDFICVICKYIIEPYSVVPLHIVPVERNKIVIVNGVAIPPRISVIQNSKNDKHANNWFSIKGNSNFLYFLAFVVGLYLIRIFPYSDAYL